MTQAEVKKLLLQAAIAYKRYSTARDKADTYRMQLTGRAVRMDNDAPHTSSGNSTEAGYIRLAELEEEEAAAKQQWLDGISAVEHLIGLLPVEIWAQVLTYRYLNNSRFEDISAALGYSDPSIYRIHKKSLRFLAEKLQNDSE